MKTKNTPAITIVLPYAGAGKYWNIWALAEQKINFRQNRFEAERCTMAFAALELKTFLSKADVDLTVTVAQTIPDTGCFIEMKIEQKDADDGFKLTPKGEGICITGHGRKGLLNGVYELLRLRGWRWLEPGAYGESPPSSKDFNWPKSEIEALPSFKYRGIDAYRESMDSVEYLLWMARNRMNVYFRKAASAKLADKLGMYSRKGGHLLASITAPDRYLLSGKTIWEEHPEWYGLPEDGGRTKALSTRVQLCMAQPALLQYIGEELLSLLNTSMDGVDIVDIWGFDTWGKTCSCEKCIAIGNGADQNLLMLSFLRNFLDQAQADRRLNRKVLLNIAVYEGTVTLEAPSKPVPENLCRAGDIGIYYPIKRCYHHALNDERCEINGLYRDALLGWGRKAPGLSLWAGEYYNVSKFEDLPLLFTGLIPSDMRFYYAVGARGATYMHCIFTNWAMRSLTQLQHAQYAWDINSDDAEFLNEYFIRKYELYADEMRQVYELIEEGSKNVSSWRNWGFGALDRLASWNGTVPEKELKLLHFDTDTEAIAACRYGANCWQEASVRIDLLLEREKAGNVGHLPAPFYTPVNPQEADAIRCYDKLEYRLGENRRLLVYGIDSMRLLANILEYYRSLYRRDFPMADKCWFEVERLAAKMATYFHPISFENPVGIICRDALSRTQLRQIITRCRGARLNKLVPEYISGATLK